MSRRRRSGPRVRPSEPLEGVVRAVGRGGDAVVEGPRGTVFVRGAWTDEAIRYRVLGKRRGVERGALLEVLTPSESRREPPCDVASRCGGCPWMFVDEAAQRVEKRAQVARVMSRAGFDGEVVVHEGDPLAYRRRARLVFHAGRVGYRPAANARGTEGAKVVDVETCPVLHASLDDALRRFRAEILPALEGAGEVSFARRDEGTALSIRAATSQSADAYAACEAAVDGHTILGVALRVGETAPAVFGVPVERTRGADGLPLEGTMGGFSQAHDALNTVLARRVGQHVGQNDRVLELYAGHGNLTLACARARSVTAVENASDAVAALRANVGARDLKGIKVVEADAADYPVGAYDVLVLDPPRSGAQGPLKRVLEDPRGRSIRKIVYVSCDLSTLGRDLELLCAAGFRVTAADAFDLFPQTPHVETLAVLSRD